MRFWGESRKEPFRGRIEFTDVNDDAAKRAHDYTAEVMIEAIDCKEQAKALAETEYVPTLRRKLVDLVCQYQRL